MIVFFFFCPPYKKNGNIDILPFAGIFKMKMRSMEESRDRGEGEIYKEDKTDHGRDQKWKVDRVRVEMYSLSSQTIWLEKGSQ